MKLVVNPSYKHSQEIVSTFNKYKDLISFKDHTQYTEELITDTIETIIECKKLELSKKHILWLTKQIYNLSLTKEQIKNDYLPLIKFHYYNQDDLASIESYLSISDLNSSIEGLENKEEAVSEKELDIFFEKDRWFVAMPHTTKASCLLGKNTDWCTSRTKTQNLFLNYVGRYSDDITLFYIIRIDGNPKKNPNDKLSVGFINGKPVFDGQEGGLTVNASNKGILLQEFSEILGKELAKEMLVKMDEKSQSIKGKHPAKLEMERVARSVEKYRKKISEFKNEDDLSAFKQEIARYNLIEEIQILLSKDREEPVKIILAENPNLTEFVQQKMYSDRNDMVNYSLFLNKNLTHSLRIKLRRFFG